MPGLILEFLHVPGESFRSLSYQYRMGDNTIGQIVVETCTALYIVMKDEFLTVGHPCYWLLLLLLTLLLLVYYQLLYTGEITLSVLILICIFPLNEESRPEHV